MELVASKCYHASGIVTIVVIFQSTVYVTLLDGSNENPLLDSRFPDVSGKGRGYQICSHENGIEMWPSLRKVSVWQTVNALEQEFRDRAAQAAQNKAGDSDDDMEDKTAQIVDEGHAAAGAAAARSESPSGAVTISRDEEKAQMKEERVDESRSVSANTGAKVAESKDEPDVGKQQPAFTESSSAGNSNDDSPSKVNLVTSYKPHHLPKLDSLSKRMDEIRKNMSGNVSVLSSQFSPMSFFPNFTYVLFCFSLFYLSWPHRGTIKACL